MEILGLAKFDSQGRIVLPKSDWTTGSFYCTWDKALEAVVLRKEGQFNKKKLDEKRRIAIPLELRRLLGEEAVLQISYKGCVFFISRFQKD